MITLRTNPRGAPQCPSICCTEQAGRQCREAGSLRKPRLQRSRQQGRWEGLDTSSQDGLQWAQGSSQAWGREEDLRPSQVKSPFFSLPRLQPGLLSGVPAFHSTGPSRQMPSASPHMALHPPRLRSPQEHLLLPTPAAGPLCPAHAVPDVLSC